VQEIGHSTDENKQEGNEDEHTAHASMDTSDPLPRDAPVIGTDEPKGPTGPTPTHDTHEIHETKEDTISVTTIKMTALPRREANPLQPTMNSNPRPQRQPEDD
jgi:hypothetical protein